MTRFRAELRARIKRAACFTPMLGWAFIMAFLAPPTRGFAFVTNPHATENSTVRVEHIHASGWGLEALIDSGQKLLKDSVYAGYRIAGQAWGAYHVTGNNNTETARTAGSSDPWLPANRPQSYSIWTLSRAAYSFVGLLMFTGLFLFLRRTGPVFSDEARVCTVEGIHGLERSPDHPSEASSEGWRGELDTARESIVVINEDDSIEAFNPAAENLFGYTVREVIGRKVDMIMPARTNSGLNGCLIQHLENNQRIISRGPQYVGRRKDGSLFPMEMIITDTRFENRNLSTGVIRDLTTSG